MTTYSKINFVLVLLTFLCLVACQSSSESAAKPPIVSSPESVSTNKDDINAYNLIAPNQAKSFLQSAPERYLPVQVSPQKIFDKGHIPNAQQIWRSGYTRKDSLNGIGGLIPDRRQLEDLIQSLGFNKGDTLLLYDAKANVDACRLAWTLSLYGFEAYKLINGGLEYWKQIGYQLTKKPSAQKLKSDFTLSNLFRNDMMIGKAEMLSAIDDTTSIIVDTREPYEYYGHPFIRKGKLYDYKDGAFDRGSIPNAIHSNWSLLADLNGDHRIKSEHDLRFDLNSKGITPDKNILLYCQSGSRTSYSYYVLKHVLGYPNVKNYDGSWIEWTYYNKLDGSTPIHHHLDDEEFLLYKNSLEHIISDNGIH